MSDKRLHELNQKQIEQWRLARQEVGRKRYGDKHLQRYGAVDIMEELLDVENILNLTYDRIRCGTLSMSDMELVIKELITFRTHLWQLQSQLLKLDKCLEDDECTDEQGGIRIFWGEKHEA